MHSAGLLAAGTALAQNTPKPRSANDRIQVACIGFGIMGQGDVKTAVTVPGVELVAVADVYDGRLKLARERYNENVFTTRDYREVLARPGVGCGDRRHTRPLAQPHRHRRHERR
jgi:Predicted homoserine dehydrogenase